MSRLVDVVQAIADVTRTIAGIVYSPMFPKEIISQFEMPAALILVDSGAYLWQAHPGETTATINKPITVSIRLALNYQETPLEDVTPEAMGLHEPLANALMTGWLSHQFNDTCPFLGRMDTGSGVAPLRWEYVEFDWGGQQAIGFDYDLDLTYTEELAYERA